MIANTHPLTQNFYSTSTSLSNDCISFIDRRPQLPFVFFEEKMRTDLPKIHLLLVSKVLDSQHLACLLQSENVQIDTAFNGFEALEKIYSNSYDVVVMDLQLHFMNGYSFVKFVQTRLKLQIPVVALVRVVEEVSQETLTEEGYDNYLYMPINPKCLQKILHSLRNNHLETEKKNNTQNNCAINVDYIKSIAPNDKSFVFEILQIFEQQTLELIQKLPNLQSNKQTEKLNKLVHKYKSSAKNVGNEPLSKLCCQIEQATRNIEPKWDEIESHCSTLIADCKKLMEEMPSILLKLENP